MEIIKGGISRDERGQIRFVNEFDMDNIKRFYIIKNIDCNTLRGWRAHRIEKRWFYAVSGVLKIAVVRIDNWKTPSKDLPIKQFFLNSEKSDVLYVPEGYGTLIQAMEENSEVIVFADHNIDHAKYDDHVYSTDCFINL